MGDKESNLAKRLARPQSLGGAFGGLVRMLGGNAASDADLAARWDEVVGLELAAQARLSALSKARPGFGPNDGRPPARVLTVRAVVPAMALSLSYRKEEIRVLVNKYFGYDAIGKIIVKK